MGLLSFIKEAGEKLIGATPAAAVVNTAEAAQAASTAILGYISSMNLSATDLAVSVEGTTVTVSGEAPDQDTHEKIVLCAGNVMGIGSVTDNMTVAAAAAADESQYHAVARGDTLSAIAKKFYGNANDYNRIFEANRPMLSHPDKIYPGQVLRIPA